MEDKHTLNIYERLFKVKKAVTYIQKKKSAGQKFATANSKDVLMNINPELIKFGLYLSTEIEESNVDRYFVKLDSKENAVFSYLVTLKVVFTFISVEDTSQKVRLPFFAVSDDKNSSYAFGKAMTYAEKTFFLKEFNIAIDEKAEEEYQLELMKKTLATKREIEGMKAFAKEVLKFSEDSTIEKILNQACVTSNIDSGKPFDKYSQFDVGTMNNTMNKWIHYYENQAKKEKKNESKQ